MGSEAYPGLSRENGDANAASCLLSDFCDAWREAMHLTDADYYGTGTRKFHCPLFRDVSKRSEESIAENYRLRHCYRYGEGGWHLVWTEARRTEQLTLPFPEERDFNNGL